MRISPVPLAEHIIHVSTIPRRYNPGGQVMADRSSRQPPASPEDPAEYLFRRAGKNWVGELRTCGDALELSGMDRPTERLCGLELLNLEIVGRCRGADTLASEGRSPARLALMRIQLGLDREKASQAYEVDIAWLQHVEEGQIPWSATTDDLFDKFEQNCRQELENEVARIKAGRSDSEASDTGTRSRKASQEPAEKGGSRIASLVCADFKMIRADLLRHKNLDPSDLSIGVAPDDRMKPAILRGEQFLIFHGDTTLAQSPLQAKAYYLMVKGKPVLAEAISRSGAIMIKFYDGNNWPEVYDPKDVEVVGRAILDLNLNLDLEEVYVPADWGPFSSH